MNETLLLYLFTRLDSLGGLMAFSAIMLGLGAICAALFHAFADIYDPANKRAELWVVRRRRAIRLGVSSLCVALATTALPTSKDLAIIVGGSMAITAAKSPQAQEIGGLVYDAIRKQLKEAAK